MLFICGKQRFMLLKKIFLYKLVQNEFYFLKLYYILTYFNLKVMCNKKKVIKKKLNKRMTCDYTEYNKESGFVTQKH